MIPAAPISAEDGRRVLVVDDEERLRKLLEAILCGEGCDVRAAPGVRQAMEALDRAPVDLVLTDIRMPGMTGMDLTQWVSQAHPETDVIVMTGFACTETAVRALRLGASDYLFKPFQDIELVVSAVQRTFEKRRLRRELVAAREELIQAGKLAAAGELGVSIAHELCQPITAIRTFAEMIGGGDGPVSPDDQDAIDRIVRATYRMERIAVNMRNLARQEGFRAAEVPASAPLDAALELLSAQLRKRGIAVHLTVAEHVPAVRADESQLQQVFVNLLANARDALARREGAATKRIHLDVRGSDANVIYVVEDDGPGVAELHGERIFESFFTTKPRGSGLGLGLSLSRRIVENHGGTIRHERPEAGGTRFVVELPRWTDER